MKNIIFLPLSPIMRSNWFKYALMFSLLIIYINRGLFVAIPSIEISNPSGNEINSLLEIIINWTGGHNDIDEDGDLSESYNMAKTAQPLIDQNMTYISLTCPYFLAHKIFCIFDEAMPSLNIYGTIDHPPEMA